LAAPASSPEHNDHIHAVESKAAERTIGSKSDEYTSINGNGERKIWHRWRRMSKNPKTKGVSVRGGVSSWNSPVKNACWEKRLEEEKCEFLQNEGREWRGTPSDSAKPLAEQWRPATVRGGGRLLKNNLRISRQQKPGWKAKNPKKGGAERLSRAGCEEKQKTHGGGSRTLLC